MRKLVISCAIVFLFSALSYARPSEPPADGGFSVSVVEQQLAAFRDGLLAQSPQRALAGFDRDHVAAYDHLAHTLALLFDRYQSVRVFYTIRQTSAEDAATGGTASVEFTMEATPYDSMQPPVRRTAELRFEFVRINRGWKVTALQPLGYFESF
jgi:hypothetical protein